MSAPWMKFYPSDWRADPALQMCSIAARGLWMEMLCIMHEADPRGSLLINGNVVTERQLASLAGVTPPEAKRLMAELEAAGVFSRDDDIVVSRRMRRDTEKAEVDKANGGKGGNPKLKRGVNPQDKAQKPETRSQMPPSGSKEPEGRAPAKPTPRSILESVLDEKRAEALVEHRKKLRVPLTDHAAQLLAAKLDRFVDPNRAADLMIEKGWQSIETDWTGVPPLKPRASADTVSGNVFIRDEDDEWPALVERYCHDKGKPPPKTDGRNQNGSGQGWRFPAQWIEELKTEKVG